MGALLFCHQIIKVRREYKNSKTRQEKITTFVSYRTKFLELFVDIAPNTWKPE